MTVNWSFLLSFAVSGMITVFIVIVILIGVLWAVNALVVLDARRACRAKRRRQEAAMAGRNL